MRRLLLTPLVALLCSVTALADPVSVGTWDQLLTNAAATANAEITLTDNITMPVGINDLNGAHINCGDFQIKATAATGEYTIKNAEITFGTGVNAYIYINKSGGTDVVVSLDNVNISSGSSKYGAIRFANYTSCTLTVANNCSINSSTKSGVQAGVPLTLINNGTITGTTGVSAGTAVITNSGSITGTTGAGISCNGTITNNEGATITGAYGVSVTGETTVLNNGAINASSYSFVAAELEAVMNITNNANIDWSIESDKVNAQDHEITNNAGNLTVYARTATKKNFTGSLTIDNVGGGSVSFPTQVLCALDLTNVTIDNAVTFSGAIEANNVTINAGTFSGAIAASNLTINAGTFNGQLSGTGITVNGGTFTVAPAAEAEGIIAGECKFPAGPAIGGLSMAAGYHAFHSGQVREVSSPGMVVTLKHGGALQTFEFLEDAFAAAQDGDEIALLGDVSTYEKIWIGTAGVNDAARTLTLDLNGHSVTSAEDVEQTFLLTHGSLYVINSVPGQGGIENATTSGKIFVVYGTYQKGINSRTANISSLFSYLNIAEGVKLNASGEGGSAIVVDDLRNNNSGASGNVYNTKYQGISENTNHGLANGIRVDVKGEIMAKKYGISLSGNVEYPDPTKFSRPVAEDMPVLKSDTAYSAFIHVYPSATISVQGDVTSAVAAYSSGYGRWLIEGKCMGATGLYVKSGSVKIKDALIESTWTQTATLTSGKDSGVENGGSAVVVESNRNYSGEQTVIVSGDSKMTSRANGGSAFLELVDPNTEGTKVDSIVIYGGIFTAKNAIIISDVTLDDPNAVVIIYGSTLNSDEEDIEAYVTPLLASGVHTTEIINSDQSRTVIVSAGSNSPNEITNFGTSADPQEDEIVKIAKQQDRPDANWTGTNSGEVSEGTTVALGELQIISGTSENDRQQLTVGENATLQVERLIMNEYATIVVEAGGKLIVDGTQGINAPDVENITLQSSEEKQAIFLFHPEVSSNRHPMATVQMISKAYRKEDGKYVYQRFGVPSYMDGITRADMHYTRPTAVYKLNYESQQWESMAMTDEFIPFQCYELTTTDAAPGAVYTFQCPLTGNSDAELVLQDKWNYYANSYSAPINIKQMINRFAEDNADAVDPTVYVYDPELDWWKAVNNGNLWRSGTPQEIAPMQAFIFKRVGNGENPNINYNEHVWTPIVDPSNVQFAPSRNRNNMSTAIIEIQDANGKKDVVTLMEGNQFSEDYDLTYDATKYINTRSFNFYVAAEEPMEMVATDNLEGNVLNLTTKDQTSFTMTFREVNGMEYAIRDMLTGTETAIVEGATYMFSTAANSTVEGRFVIVPVAKMPTAIEHIEATAATKGIYTISGQFVGYDYHALPMGVYVVDGKKIVK